MSKIIEAILQQALRDSASELKSNPMMSREDRESRYCSILEWARWKVAVNGGRWVDYASPFEAQLAEALKV